MALLLILTCSAKLRKTSTSPLLAASDNARGACASAGALALEGLLQTSNGRFCNYGRH